jgi:hypothetical protein
MIAAAAASKLIVCLAYQCLGMAWCRRWARRRG